MWLGCGLVPHSSPPVLSILLSNILMVSWRGEEEEGGRGEKEEGGRGEKEEGGREGEET